MAESHEGGTEISIEDPFQDMKIDDCKILDQVDGRCICPECNKSRKYFCYTCYIPVPTLKDHVPRVKLPVKIDIIKHSREIDGKSTAAHAAVIAPEDVTIYTYPCIPDYPLEENVVLIFPGKNALTIQEYIHSHKSRHDDSHHDDPEPRKKRPHLSNKVPITRAVFIDSTWNQSRGIYKDPRLRAVPCVVFQSRISQFWRHQHGSPRWFLATIEAVHQFLVELHIHCKLGDYSSTHETEKNIAEEKSVQASLDDKETKYINKKGTDIIDSGSSSEVHTLEDKSCSAEMSLSEKHDKKPSKFVKNLALCRGIRVDPGGDPGIKLLGPDQWKGKYGGEYDNVLFFFRFMYNKIHSIYDHETLRSYQRPME